MSDSTGFYKYFPTRTKEWVDTYIAPFEGHGADLEPAESWDPILLPDPGVSSGGFKPSARQLSMDEFLELNFRDSMQVAVDWFGKDAQIVKKGNRYWTRCPIPGHTDENPSCHVTFNSPKADGKDVWNCFGCAVGGDAYTFIAAAEGDRLGIRMQDLSTNFNNAFVKLREYIAEALGWVAPMAEPEEGDSPKEVAPVVEAVEEEPLPPAEPPIGVVAPVVSLFADADANSTKPPVVKIPWEEIVPSSSFVHEYVSRVSPLDIPDEFLFWQALQMVGLAAGRDCYIPATPNIFPTLNLILKSETGSGKSRSIRIMQQVLHDAVPYDYNNPTSRGVLMGGEPGSGEVVLATYAREYDDPANPGKTLKVRGMRALWTIDELSSLIARAARASTGTITQTLMTLHDAPSHMTYRVRSGDLIAEEPFGSVIAGTQPEVMRNFLTRADALSGFLNRWIHVEGMPKPRHAVQDIQVDLEPPTAMLRSLSAWSQRGIPIEIKRGGGGRARWEEFFGDEIVPLQAQGSPIFGRIDLMMLKIMMLLAINEKESSINSVIVDRAIKLWPYLLHTYKGTLDSVSLSTKDRVADKIEEVLKARSISKGRLRKVMADAGFAWDDVTGVIRDMERMGVIENMPFSNPKGGPKTHQLVWKAS